MAKDGTQTVAGLAGGLYIAPVGTAFPASITTAPSVTWTDLGYFRTDGLTKSKEVTSTDIKGWPGGVTIRSLITETVEGIQGTLLQVINPEAWKLVNGGGAFAGGVYTPPAGDQDYRVAVILELQDGVNKMRFLVPNAKNVASANMPFPSDNLAEAAIDLRFQAPASGPLYTVQTNLTAWSYVAP